MHACHSLQIKNNATLYDKNTFENNVSNRGLWNYNRVDKANAAQKEWLEKEKQEQEELYAKLQKEREVLSQCSEQVCLA